MRLFRVVWLALAIVACCVTAGAAQAAPTFVPIQGSLSDSDGVPQSGTHTLEFRLYSEGEGGVAFFAESQKVEIDAGRFTAYLGDGAPVDLGDGSTSGRLDLAIFGQRPLGIVFLGVTIGDEPEMAPRLQLGSVPFAAHAQTCGDAITLEGLSADSFASTDAGSLASGTLDKARLPALSAADISSGTLDRARLPALSAADIGSGTFSASRIPALPYAATNHGHGASEITSGTFDKARIPGLGDVYLERGRFAWGRHEVLGATTNGSGSIHDPNGASNNASGPAMGAVDINVPNIGCSDPFVWVSPNSNGDWNFTQTNVRHYTLVDGTAGFTVRWINLYQQGGHTISFDWLAFCP